MMHFVAQCSLSCHPCRKRLLFSPQRYDTQKKKNGTDTDFYGATKVNNVVSLISSHKNSLVPSVDELLLRGPGDQEDPGPEPLCEVTVNISC